MTITTVRSIGAKLLTLAAATKAAVGGGTSASVPKAVTAEGAGKQKRKRSVKQVAAEAEDDEEELPAAGKERMQIKE